MGRSSRIGNESETTLHGRDESIVSDHILLNLNKDEREEAARLKSLERYDFVLLVVIMSRVLSEISIATQYRQRKDSNLQRPSITYRRYRSTCQSIVAKFAEVKNEATNVCANWGVLAKFEQKRLSKKSTFWRTI